MFADRLDMFLEKRYNNVGFYVGLALYRTDTDNANNEPGWGKKSTILTEQIADLLLELNKEGLELQDDADLPRFAKLGVNANYMPWWHAGNMGGYPFETWRALLGEKRALAMYLN